MVFYLYRSVYNFGSIFIDHVVVSRCMIKLWVNYIRWKLGMHPTGRLEFKTQRYSFLKLSRTIKAYYNCRHTYNLCPKSETLPSYFSAATGEAILRVVARNSDYSMILLAAHTFADCLNTKKAELCALKERSAMCHCPFNFDIDCTGYECQRKRHIWTLWFNQWN
jgi:hypothetical protein